MKLFIFAIGIFSSVSVFANYKYDCSRKMIALGLSHPKQIDWVCRNSTRYTVEVINYAISANLNRVDSLAFVAGGKATGWTKYCLNLLIHHSGYTRVDSLGMLCRDVSRDSYSSIYRYIQNGMNPDYLSVELAYIYSKDSLRSFLQTFRELKERDFCSVANCPPELDLENL